MVYFIVMHYELSFISRLKCYHVDKADYLSVALKHCRTISSVKIWFADAAFAGEVLSKLTVHDL